MSSRARQTTLRHTRSAPVVAAALLGTVNAIACNELVARCARDPRHAGIDEDLARATEALTSSHRSAGAIHSEVEKALANVPRFDPAPLVVGLFPDLWRKDCDELAELAELHGR